MPPKENRGPQSGAASPTFEPYALVSERSARRSKPNQLFLPNEGMPSFDTGDFVTKLVAGAINWQGIPAKAQKDQAVVKAIVNAYPSIVFYKGFPATENEYLKIVQRKANDDHTLELMKSIHTVRVENPGMLEKIEDALFCKLVVKVYENSEYFQKAVKTLVQPFFDVSADTVSALRKQQIKKVIKNAKFVGFLLSACTVPVDKLYQFYTPEEEKDVGRIETINVEFVYFSKKLVKDASWKEKFDRNYSAFLVKSLMMMEPFNPGSKENELFAELLFKFLPQYVFLAFFSLPAYSPLAHEMFFFWLGQQNKEYRAKVQKWLTEWVKSDALKNMKVIHDSIVTKALQDHALSE